MFRWKGLWLSVVVSGSFDRTLGAHHQRPGARRHTRPGFVVRNFRVYVAGCLLVGGGVGVGRGLEGIGHKAGGQSLNPHQVKTTENLDKVFASLRRFVPFSQTSEARLLKAPGNLGLNQLGGV